MKKIALSLIALAAVSTAALAERNYDLRDSNPYMITNEAVSVEKLSVPADKWQVFYSRGNFTTDAKEARRWDEKNG